MIELAAGPYRLALEPERGGSIARFEHEGAALLRPTCGPSMLDTACFPLVPFSNRIANGRFQHDGREIRLAPNFPGSDHPHPLHGFGWLAPWEIVDATEHHARLRHVHDAGEWPWRYEAEQHFTLSDGGLDCRLSLVNQSNSPMPAGLGFHPYFPRDDRTRYVGLHRGEWQNDVDGIPLELREAPHPIDWWRGPVAARAVDTVYTERSGPLTIAWPDRGLALRLDPTGNLPFTVVYSPTDSDFFCVEPVSHMTDAINRPHTPSGLRWLDPGERMEVGLHLAATAFR